MELVFATNNAHKLEEMRQILSRLPGEEISILSLADIGCTEDIPETGDTLAANSAIKARYVYSRYGKDCFADDTGLEVDCLGGAPGVRSARYAPGEGHDSQANMRLLLANMEGSDERSARFRTVITLILGGVEHTFVGEVNGEITREPEGDGGFGYDPVFRPDGWDKTFGNASADEKNAVSHRARAGAALYDFLEKNR